MFISVDLPAPFSPRSACTSPSRQVEAHVVVGDDPREALRDVLHLEDLRALGHGRAILVRLRHHESGRSGTCADAASAPSGREIASPSGDPRARLHRVRNDGGRARRPAHLDLLCLLAELLDGGRRLDLAGGDVLRPLAERFRSARRACGAVVETLPTPTPPFFDVEDAVGAALPLASLTWPA